MARPMDKLRRCSIFYLILCFVDFSPDDGDVISDILQELSNHNER